MRRGRFLVVDPYLEPGYPLALGRRGSAVAAEGELVLVEVAPTGGRARVRERLGSPWDVRALLHGAAGEAGAALPFPPDVEAEAFALPADPPPPAGDRRDLRDRIAFTVDPGTAKDHDDALSVERDGDGLRVLVHIADVAAAVPEGSALDREALARGFSSYLPGRVDPMLPPELSAGLCSLVPDRPRDAVTVELPFDAALRPGRPAFYRSQIVSRRRFAYADVERILDGADDALADPVHDAARIATALRERRTARGALTIPSRELEIGLDEGRVASVRMIGEPAAHALVEELMIAANEAVAELLARRKAPALYRVHEQPDPAGVERLYAQLTDLGVPTPPLPTRSRRRMPPPPSAVRRRSSRGMRPRSAGARRRGRRCSCGPSCRPATRRRTAATPVSRRRTTATSRARSAATPTSPSIARCWGRSASARCPTGRASTTSPSRCPSGSGSGRGSSAGAMRSALRPTSGITTTTITGRGRARSRA